MADPQNVIVVYAKADRQWQRTVALTQDMTLEQAVRQSGLMEELPEINLAVMRTGIFGKLKPPDTLLRDKDRIELYRPLTADPKESRRQRLSQQQRRGNEKRSDGQLGT